MSLINGERETRDQLTGALTTTVFVQRIEELRTAHPGEPYTFVYILIPNFKSINRGFGYVSGNQFLQQFTELLEDCFAGQMVARESSHHFMVLDRDHSSAETLELLRECQAAVNRMKGGEHLLLNAGLVSGRLGELGEGDIYQNIDRARYACSYAERSHSRQFVVYGSDVQRRIDFELYLMREFFPAMERGDIQPFYQPEIRVLTEQCCGYEALARWVDPQYGLIAPDAFIPLLERELLIPQLDLHMIRQVCRDIRRNLDGGVITVPVSVNLSRVDFQVLDIFEEVEKIREEFNVPRYYLNIEITESAIAEGSVYMAPVIDRFRQVGYQVWMDDFGSGYSSLNTLQDFNFDVLKIDMGFLKKFRVNPKTSVIIREIVNLAKRMGLGSLAEGVETREQLEFLKECGCEKVQGYLFSKALQVDRSDASGIPILMEEGRCIPREKREESRYYQRIADVNFLSSSPMEEGLYLTANALPIVIIEVIGGKRVNFLYSNDAYRRILRAAGIDDLEAANVRGNEEDIPENHQYLELATRAEEIERVRGDILINGVIFKTDMMFLARKDDRAAFLNVVQNLSPNFNNAQVEAMSLAQEYILTEYFRVDLFNDDGTVVNVYLDADQSRITDEIDRAAPAVEQYASLYIRADEAGDFCDFYRIDTVLDRVRQIGEKHLTRFFHSADSTHNDELQCYTITPFRMGEKWKFLSTCRRLK